MSQEGLTVNWPVRCSSVSPQGMRCGLPEGHDDDHNALVPTNMPWFGKQDVTKWRQKA